MYFCFFFFTDSQEVTNDEPNGLTTVKSKLTLTLTRHELGAHLECRVESGALGTIVRNSFQIDLQGKCKKKGGKAQKKNSTDFLTFFIFPQFPLLLLLLLPFIFLSYFAYPYSLSMVKRWNERQ